MKVALVVFDDVQGLDVFGPCDVFSEANTFLPEGRRYEVALVGVHAGTQRCANGMEFNVPYDYRSYPFHCDLLLVSGGPRLPAFKPEAPFLDWLREQAQESGRFGSVCNGAFLLGHAGLLDGHEVTTHWSAAKRLEEQFPKAAVRSDRIFIRDGRLFTSAGVTAGIDLCLSLVAEDWGHELAVKVAKNLVVYIHREGGQSQYSPFLAANPEEDTIVSRVLRYTTEHIGESFSMEELALGIGVSHRTFHRLFLRHSGITPAVFVEQVRVDHARKLLEETDAPLKTVAFNCGFRSATHMRMIFARRVNITPKQYRQRFRGMEDGRNQPLLGPLPGAGTEDGTEFITSTLDDELPSADGLPQVAVRPNQVI
jgi:transcriptional regulator GlxA family with amidase domain